ADTVAKGLADCVLPGMRMKISELNCVTWINDAYNASPESVKAALQWLSEFTVQKSMILALGDMLELGKASTDEHRQVLQKAFSLFQESTFILVGEHMQAASNGLNIPPNATFCANSSLAAQQLATLAVPGKTVFLKASRGIHLENAVPEK
ncbi:MAG: cyanophycin synthetase, partial [Victivallaceae bacterium]